MFGVSAGRSGHYCDFGVESGQSSQAEVSIDRLSPRSKGFIVYSFLFLFLAFCVVTSVHQQFFSDIMPIGGGICGSKGCGSAQPC